MLERLLEEISTLQIKKKKRKHTNSSSYFGNAYMAITIPENVYAYNKKNALFQRFQNSYNFLIEVESTVLLKFCKNLSGK